MINCIIKAPAITVPTLLSLPVRCTEPTTESTGRINAEFGSNFEKPVVYYRQFISGVDGRKAEDSAPDGRIIEAKKLEEIAAN